MEYYNKEIETMSREKLNKLQSQRLVECVKRVYDNVKPYREKMDAIGLKPSDIKSIADLPKLPFTTKKDLRDNYPFGMFCAKKTDIVRLHASSGTTGKLTVVGYTAKDIDIWANLMARCLVMTGASRESVVHVAYGYGLFTGGLGAHYGAEKLGAVAVPASSGNTDRQLMLMEDFAATHLCCTPSYAIYLGEEKIKRNLKLPKLESGIFGAEPWSEEMRTQIEKSLGIDAYDIYGLSEIMGPGVAMECQMKDGLHVMEEHFLPEIVDPDTLKPLNEGEIGELVFTTITKEGIPLIRYRTRDITSLTYKKCKCGRTHARLGKITGRTDDMLIIRGVNVFPSQIETALLHFSEFIESQYQIIVDRKGVLDEMEIQVERKHGVNDEMFIEKLNRNISKEVASAIGISANIKILANNSIPRSEGKAKRVIDNRKI